MEQAADNRDTALARSTRRAYGSDWADFAAWCRRKGLSAMPASAESVAQYLAELSETYKISTLQRRMVSITHVYKAAGLDTPIADPVVRLAWDRIASPRQPGEESGEKDSWAARIARVKGASDLMFH